MAVKTQAQLLAEVASLLADNTTGDISALDVRTCLNDIIDSASYGGKKVYKALLTQTGTSAPVETVLENTLSGTPVWSRTGAGNYKMTLNGEFLINKTFVSPFGDFEGAAGTYLTVSNGSSIVGYYSMYPSNSTNFIGFEFRDNAFTLTDMSSVMTTTKILVYIEVYP